MTTLYQRLGGAEGIGRLVDDIIEAHMHNPAIRARFLPYREDPEHLEHLKQHLRDFLGAGSGGPEVYSGRDMVAAHRGLNVSEAEYMAALDDILSTLDRHEIEPRARQEVLAIAYGLKEDILRV